tara:strand:+ start:43 stop:588 length:546 start_codon:yes stop_codon:yes gene_type:complete
MYYLADTEELNKKDDRLNLNDYYVFKNGFSEEECLKIIRDNEASNKLEFSEKNFWIYKKLSGFAMEANRESWHFDLHGFCDPIILESFLGEGVYAPRSDMAKNFFNECKQYSKVSFHIPLSKEQDYTGGEHLIHNSGTPVYAEKEMGTCLLFPSYMISGVTPVTKGNKYWLRGFLFGSHFK